MKNSLVAFGVSLSLAICAQGQESGDCSLDSNQDGIPDCADLTGQVLVVDDDLQQAPNADYSQIQEAVAAAQDGAAILVYPGRYTSASDNVVFIQGKGVQLIGVGGYAETIIDCENARGGIRAEISSTHTLLVHGFTIDSYSGCFSAGGDPPSCNFGLVVVADPGAAATVDSCVIRNGSGFALGMLGRSANNGDADLIVRDTMVLNNVGPANSGADWLMATSYSTSRFEECSFIGNIAGQLMLSYWGSTVFAGCMFVDNELLPVTGPYGGGTLCQDPRYSSDIMTIENCRFINSSPGCVVRANGNNAIQIFNSFACDSSGVPSLCATMSQADIDLTDMYVELDCNENGITDAIEIFEGSVEDSDHDGVIDCCEVGGSCICAGDTDGNDVIDATDLGILLALWGNDGGTIPAADVNGDGFVGSADLGILLASWGPCEP